MLEFLCQGDTVVDFPHFFRSTKDLIDIIEYISQKGLNLKNLKETRIDIGSGTKNE